MSTSSSFPLDTHRHSGAHILATAIYDMFPEAQFGVGPTTENGFYYDVLLPRTLIPEDLEILEQKMQEIVKADLPIEYSVMPIDEAIKLFTKLGQPLKVELLKDLKEHGTTSFQEIYGDEKGSDFHPEIQEVSVYKIGNFVDLCRGPHVERTGQIDMRAIKLDKISAAYFRGDAHRESLQRVYGLQFGDKKELNTFLHNREEAKKRDHRELNKTLRLFDFDDEVGVGLPLWLPNGGTIIELIESLAKQKELAQGYKRVKSPHIAKSELYIRSGHLPYYEEDMYPPIKMDNEVYYLKAMNCPHHHKIYSADSKSYRDLPLRLAEYGTCYRFEDSGALMGLMRVRSLQMNDAHIYCTEEQFADEFKKVIELYLEYFEIFGIEKFEMRLSKHSPDKLGKKYVNEPKLWLHTEKLVRDVLVNLAVPFVEVDDEAAFYGPKIDVQIWSVIGREFTLATNQLDFAVPKKFNLTYIDSDGEEKTPLCIHRAPLSTHERFIGFLTEHFAGRFPFWLAPEQVRVLSVNDSPEVLSYLTQIEKILTSTVLMHPLKYNELRYSIDTTTESLGKKIRKASTEKIPVMIIVGPRDLENQTVSIRTQEGEKTLPLTELQDFLITC